MWRRDAPSEADTSDDGSRGSSSCNSSAPSSPPLRRPGKERKGCVAVLLVLSSSSADAEAGLVRRLREATARVLAKKHGRDAAAKLLGRLVLRSRARLGLAELRAILSESLKHADRFAHWESAERREQASSSRRRSSVALPRAVSNGGDVDDARRHVSATARECDDEAHSPPSC